ncbi:hypothetical protein ACF8SB_24140, partial [Pseudomonas sp. CJQ_8]|uniref:hypothetical protein n=1 Tax=Pseudomonas sp. CJQ_8 TaxID=3367167 RepID=UPI00370B5077
TLTSVTVLNIFGLADGLSDTCPNGFLPSLALRCCHPLIKDDYGKFHHCSRYAHEIFYNYYEWRD